MQRRRPNASVCAQRSATRSRRRTESASSRSLSAVLRMQRTPRVIISNPAFSRSLRRAQVCRQLQGLAPWRRQYPREATRIHRHCRRVTAVRTRAAKRTRHEHRQYCDRRNVQPVRDLRAARPTASSNGTATGRQCQASRVRATSRPRARALITRTDCRQRTHRHTQALVDEVYEVQRLRRGRRTATRA